MVHRLVLACALIGATASCTDAQEGGEQPDAQQFPHAYRPVSSLGSTAFSTEQVRDDRSEAQSVMDLAAIRPGMTVADIGAGEGYYTIRLANRVGNQGRVLAQDIDEDALRRLGNRVERERLDNVSIKLGSPDDPGLPTRSFDRIFLVHMYHEVAEPYAFLWRLFPALNENGQIIVVDTDRPTDEHGIDPQLLFCEFAQVGFRLVEFERKPEILGYYAQFEAAGPRPQPAEIDPCSKPEDTEAVL